MKHLCIYCMDTVAETIDGLLTLRAFNYQKTAVTILSTRSDKHTCQHCCRVDTAANIVAQ